MLRHLPRRPDPNLLVGDNPADDAAVYRLSAELALVQTIDFFTPVVDDPYDFGRIAAANSLSDVYAVGGKPLHALNIVGFPMTGLSTEILTEILRGGMEAASEAGISIVGGHTVDDTEPKYGLSVTGTVDPRFVVTTRGARPGDVLVLTKPLGTGVITTALKNGAATKAHVQQAVRWMTLLNRRAGDAMLEIGVHAATDITGYGLLGHLADMCRASEVSSRVSMRDIPILPGAAQYASEGYIPSGGRTNLEYLDGTVRWESGIDEIQKLLLTDPQTSGGLLVAVPEAASRSYVSIVSTVALAAPIGVVMPKGNPIIVVAE